MSKLMSGAILRRIGLIYNITTDENGYYEKYLPMDVTCEYYTTNRTLLETIEIGQDESLVQDIVVESAEE